MSTDTHSIHLISYREVVKAKKLECVDPGKESLPLWGVDMHQCCEIGQVNPEVSVCVGVGV